MSESTPLPKVRMGIRSTAFIWLFLAIVAGGVIQLWYWLLWPGTPITLNRPIEVTQVQTFGANNTLIYQMDYCKGTRFVNEAAEVHYMLMNHDGVLHELAGMTMGTLPSGCHVLNIAVPIPQVKGGQYSLRMIRVYHVNPLKTISVQSESRQFTIPVNPVVTWPADLK